MTEPSAEERAKATALVHLWASSPEPVHLGHDAKWMAKDIADLLHAHAEAVRAELGQWSADAASRYAAMRVKAAVRAERERCAECADRMVFKGDRNSKDLVSLCALTIGDAIRAREKLSDTDSGHLPSGAA